MAFFNSAVGVLQTLVVALGAGLGIWGVINLMEGYGNDNPGAKSQGMKHLIPKLMYRKLRTNALCMPQFLEKNCKIALCFLNKGSIIVERP